MLAFLIALLAAILPACPAEDATNCSWDASTRGNGLGSSFISINDQTYYL